MSPSLSDLEKLKRWMEEFVLDRRMGEDEGDALGDGEPIDFSDEPAPADNQIRLWPAGGENEQPVYGLIRSEGYDRWQVFPFSPYAFPALPEELAVREDPPVRVVQGWNCRWVTTHEVSASWQVSELNGEMVLFFERWWLALRAESLDPGVFGAKTGPQLRHPLDPRLEYMDAERVRVDAVLGEAPVDYGESGVQMAAEDEVDEYGTTGRGRSGGEDGEG